MSKTSELYTKGLYKIYTRDNCVYCEAAKVLMNKYGLHITEFNLESHPHHRDELKMLVPNATTVPQIFVGQKHIGGYDDFKLYAEESLESGR